VVEPEPLHQAHRDQRAAEPVLEVGPMAQVGRQRQRRDDLRGANVISLARMHL
jgi:hypothetical protein